MPSLGKMAGSEVIDLTELKSSNAITQNSNVLETTNNDDDVIIVSSNLPPIIDLCTPPSGEDEHGYTKTHRYELRNRVSGTQFQSKNKKSKILIEDNADHSRIFNCPVCMESSIRRKPTSTQCGHIFCGKCIKQIIRLTRKCPICSTKLSESQIFRLYV